MSSHRYLHEPLGMEPLSEIQDGVFGKSAPSPVEIKAPLGSILNEGTLAENEHQIAPLPLSDADFIQADQVPPQHG